MFSSKSQVGDRAFAMIEGTTMNEQRCPKTECGLKRKGCLGQKSEENQYLMFREEVKVKDD